MPPSWIMKLTEGCGEPKNDSKGEDDRLKASWSIVLFVSVVIGQINYFGFGLTTLS